MKKFLGIAIFVIMVMTSAQQTLSQNVGINTNTPDVSAVLDIKSITSNQGVLPPFVNLVTTTFPSPGPANGLVVHNSNAAYGQGIGLYQNYGSALSPIWLKLLTRNDAWYLFGNRITSAGTPATYGTSKIPSGNWFGTANATDLAFGTDSTERMRIDNAGNVGINKIPIYKLDVENGTDRSYFHGGIAGSTESYVTLARSNYEGVNAFAYNDDGIESTTASAFYNGVYGKNTNNGGDAIWGYNTAAGSTGGGAGVVGISAQSGAGGTGIWGENSNLSGTGAVGTGQGQLASYLVSGSGGAFTGNTTGAYIKSNAAGNYALQVSGVGNGTYTTTTNPSGYWGLIVGAGGQLSTAANFTVSDKRFKKDITTLPTGTLQKILQLNPCNYLYDNKKYPMFKGETRKQSGFVAQEVEQVFPELVTNQKYMPDPTFDPTINSSIENKKIVSKKNVSATGDKEIPQVKGYYAVDYVSMIPYLVKAIQEQQQIIESLQIEIESLKNK